MSILVTLIVVFKGILSFYITPSDPYYKRMKQKTSKSMRLLSYMFFLYKKKKKI